MSLAATLLSTYRLPQGAVAVGEVRHPSDVAHIAADFPEIWILDRRPVIRLLTGIEALWDGVTCRSIQKDWRTLPGAIEYPEPPLAA